MGVGEWSRREGGRRYRLFLLYHVVLGLATLPTDTCSSSSERRNKRRLGTAVAAAVALLSVSGHVRSNEYHYVCALTIMYLTALFPTHLLSLFPRNNNRASPLFKGDPELAAAVSSFRGWAANAEAQAEKYNAPPASIDFAKAKSAVRDTALVDALEAMYKSNKPPVESYEWSADDQADKAKQIEDAKGRLAFTQDMIEDTEKELVFMRQNRLNREMSVGDMKELYPDIAEEVETEIENREWFKDTLSK